ncbi:MAG: CheR family methyltransferase [Vulcanimicrobiota bacterium]
MFFTIKEKNKKELLASFLKENPRCNFTTEEIEAGINKYSSLKFEKLAESFFSTSLAVFTENCRKATGALYKKESFLLPATYREITDSFISEVLFKTNSGQLSGNMTPRTWLKQTLIKQMKSGIQGPPVQVRILVPECHTGESAYLSACQFRLLLPPAVQIKVTAFDSHKTSIEAAQAALYSKEQLHSLSESFKSIYAEEKGESFTFNHDIKSMVVFKQLNLFETDAKKLTEFFQQKFDFIAADNLLKFYPQQLAAYLLCKCGILLSEGGAISGNESIPSECIGLKNKENSEFGWLERTKTINSEKLKFSSIIDFKFSIFSYFIKNLVIDNQFEEAQQLINEYSEKKPPQPGIYMLWGDIHTLNGNPEQAIASYTRAAEFDKSPLAAQYNLACLYLVQGEKEKAEGKIASLLEKLASPLDKEELRFIEMGQNQFLTLVDNLNTLLSEKDNITLEELMNFSQEQPVDEIDEGQKQDADMLEPSNKTAEEEPANTIPEEIDLFGGETLIKQVKANARIISEEDLKNQDHKTELRETEDIDVSLVKKPGSSRKKIRSEIKTPIKKLNFRKEESQLIRTPDALFYKQPEIDRQAAYAELPLPEAPTREKQPDSLKEQVLQAEKHRKKRHETKKVIKKKDTRIDPGYIRISLAVFSLLLLLVWTPHIISFFSYMSADATSQGEVINSELAKRNFGFGSGAEKIYSVKYKFNSNGTEHENVSYYSNFGDYATTVMKFNSGDRVTIEYNENNPQVSRIQYMRPTPERFFNPYAIVMILGLFISVFAYLKVEIGLF